MTELANQLLANEFVRTIYIEIHHKLDLAHIATGILHRKRKKDTHTLTVSIKKSDHCTYGEFNM